ncbi:hypothetical protein OsJ_14346 [Oryza sativa Japonica Group]|uniref:Uncharacterized protein n=1 Tax=Oryza sativa subsp. japonica TaxID=39947 RepID=A3ASL1_ORYSJ|nr:hypothetical protein OsJ_14346 [Oryza sativa Japonica Group]
MVRHVSIIKDWSSFLGQAWCGSIDLNSVQSKYIDHDISKEEIFSSLDPLVQLVVEVGREATAASPPQFVVHKVEIVTGKREASPPEKKECDYRNEGLGTARSGGTGTLIGSRQVEPRGKSMGTAIDSEPTVIDLFNELHCSKLKVLVNL